MLVIHPSVIVQETPSDDSTRMLHITEPFGDMSVPRDDGLDYHCLSDNGYRSVDANGDTKEFADLLMDVTGVRGVSLDHYTITLLKAPNVSWNNVIPESIERIKSALGWTNREVDVSTQHLMYNNSRP